MSGDMAEVTRLVDENPECVNSLGELGGRHVWPLHIAIINRHGEVATYLIDHGADINQRMEEEENGQYQGETPLLVAVYRKYEDMVELLLSKGADATLMTDSEATALMMATQTGSFGCVKVLLAHHQAATTINLMHGTGGCNAVFIATLRGHEDIVRVLLDAGAYPMIGGYNNKVNFCLQVAMSESHHGCATILEVKREGVYHVLLLYT